MAKEKKKKEHKNDAPKEKKNKKDKDAANEKKNKGDKVSKEKKNKEDKVIVAEFKISMHCNGCESTVAKAISKIKGVEQYTTEMSKNKVVIKGRINAEKVLKKLKKKTGKRVEMVSSKEDKKEAKKEEDSAALREIPKMDNFVFDYWGDSVVYNMFSDENPNACSIM